MTYIFILLALLNGIISIGAMIVLRIKPGEVNRTTIKVVALFLVNALFFGVAAYLV